MVFNIIFLCLLWVKIENGHQKRKLLCPESTEIDCRLGVLRIIIYTIWFGRHLCLTLQVGFSSIVLCPPAKKWTTRWRCTFKSKNWQILPFEKIPNMIAIYNFCHILLQVSFSFENWKLFHLEKERKNVNYIPSGRHLYLILQGVLNSVFFNR